MILLLLVRSASADPCAPTAPVAERSLAVATLNAWGLPAPVAADRRGRLPRIARWVEEGGYDFVGLQELWRGALRLFPSLRDPLTLPASTADSGLALVTSHPVRASRTHTFRAERGLDALKAKGLLVAELDLDGAALTVGVTHLQAGGGARDASVRALQVGELLAELGGDEGATVLVGDFNLYDDQPVDAQSWTRLEDAGFVDVGARTGATDPTYPGLPDRFDRIYVRDGRERCLVAREARVLDLAPSLSDHRAVEATLGAFAR